MDEEYNRYEDQLIPPGQEPYDPAYDPNAGYAPSSYIEGGDTLITPGMSVGSGVFPESSGISSDGFPTYMPPTAKSAGTLGWPTGGGSRDDRGTPTLRSMNILSRTFAPLPSFPSAPVYNQGQVAKYGQMAAAPHIRSLRSGLQRVSSQYQANPNVKANTLRAALQGYGQGLETVMSGAQQAGQQMYKPEYDVQTQQWRDQYNSLMEKWKASIGTVSL